MSLTLKKIEIIHIAFDLSFHHVYLSGRVSKVNLVCVISVLVLLCFHARLFIDVLWSPAGKGLTSRLSFVMSNCEVVTFPCTNVRHVPEEMLKPWTTDLVVIEGDLISQSYTGEVFRPVVLPFLC